MIRLAIAVSHPIQHFAPWHREVAKLPGIELMVFFYTQWGRSDGYLDPGFSRTVKWDVPLLEGYDYEFLNSAKNLDKKSFFAVDNPDLASALTRFSPDVVKVFGWAYRSNWRVASWTKRFRKPLLVYTDANIKSPVPVWKQVLKLPIVSHFYNKIDGALYVGDNNREVHRYYGLPENRLFEGVLPIDRNRILAGVPDRCVARTEIRKQYGIPHDAFVVIFCGKYQMIKSPVDLVAAIRALSRRGLSVWALMVGEGGQRAAIESFCAREDVRNVTLTGFVNQSEVPRYFAASDALAVTSWLDNHPLVVSEAACFGLPVVISDRVGCIGPNDTARPGVNAIVYPWGDCTRLAAAIESLVIDDNTYKKMACASVEISKTQDITVAARQLAEAVAKLKELGPR